MSNIRAMSGTDADAQGIDAQTLLGHTDRRTTRIYLRDKTTPTVRGPVMKRPKSALERGMGDKVSTEIIRRVYDDSEGTFIEVGPDGDGLDCVEVRTTDKESRDYWGAILFSMPKPMARALGEALIAASKDEAPTP